MKLAIFDFDGTLFPKDTLPFLLSQWYGLNYSKTKLAKVYLPLFPLYVKYKLGVNSNLSKEEMRRKAMEEFNRIFIDMTEKEVSEYFSNVSQSIKELLNPSVVEEVKKSRDAGFHTVILSGAHRLLLDDIGKHLKIDTIIGSEIYFKDDLFNHEKKPDLISSSLKLKRIHQHFSDVAVDWKKSYAYADSFGDLPLLETVGHPVVVNPDAKLKSLAAEKNWKLMK